MGYQPPQGDIPSALRRAFRRALLQHLGEHGARTLDELAQNPPGIMHLPLEAQEIAAALDLSRRRGEVEPTAGNEQNVTKGEWGLTEFGRPHARRLTSLAVTKASSVVAAIVALLGVATALNFEVSLNNIDWRKWIAIGITIFLIAEIVLLFLLDYRYGVSRREIARRWIRYQRVRPFGFAFYRRRRLMLIISVAFISSFLLTIIVLPAKAILWVVLPLLVLAAAAQLWFGANFRLTKKEWRAVEHRQ